MYVYIDYLYEYTCDIYIYIYVCVPVCVYVSEKHIYVHKYKQEDVYICMYAGVARLGILTLGSWRVVFLLLSGALRSEEKSGSPLSSAP